MKSSSHPVLVTGASGYLGRALMPALVERGHDVRALVRRKSTDSSFSGIEQIVGNPLDAADVARALEGCDTLVHLVGVPKPSPAKAREFEAIDGVSIQASVEAARSSATTPHVVYVSVAQPAPIMQAYIAVRARGEAMLQAAGLRSTCLRPWYVLGPGHRWPYLFVPAYALMRMIPATRESAERLALVTHAQMTRALVQAIENPPASGQRIVTPLEIRAASLSSRPQGNSPAQQAR